MTRRFEYAIIDLTAGDADHNSKELPRLGELGYEACGLVNNSKSMLFKRAMPVEYEYCIEAPPSRTDENLLTWFNYMGKQAWRMCESINNGGKYMFMREKLL